MVQKFGPFEVSFKAWDGSQYVDRTGKVSVSIDPERVARLLAGRAHKSKGRKSVEIGGLVEVVAL